MKLLGIEFNRYACFERCFVPLDTGIRLLVGRNNSGKTALLRGLETLRGLPFPGRGAFDTGVSRYSRAQDPYPHHFISIYFEYEPGDKAFLPEGVGAWPSFIAANRLQWKFSFTVIPSSGAMLFNGIDILIGQEKTVVLESRKNDVIRYHYNLDGSTHRVDTVAGKSGEVLSDGNILHTYDLSGVFSAFPKLMQTRMVSAHRVVRPLHQLQALDTLTDNADSLAPFLDTILSNDRERFNQIEAVVLDIFPEFKLVNPEKTQNGVSVSLTKRDTEQRIPLTHCGTGVEQILAIATFVLTAKPGTIVLLDEPHSYLHPIAERRLVDFLFAHPEHRYVIATHSAILINAVSPDRILALGQPDILPNTSISTNSISSLLHSLGYKNSDLLFNDRLIFVEGESDQEILPLLLSRNPLLSIAGLDKTGLPVMDGEGKLRGRDQQRSLLYWEKFLSQLGKQATPRIYLFDGGCVQEDRKLLEKTSVFSSGSAALLRFLLMNEIENYLLVPEAILATLKEIGDFQGEYPAGLDEATVRAQLDKLLADIENHKLYPNGPGDDPRQFVKGSVVLDMLFAAYGIRYDKKKVGRLIATKISYENQPLLKDIWDLFPRDFLPYK